MQITIIVSFQKPPLYFSERAAHIKAMFILVVMVNTFLIFELERLCFSNGSETYGFGGSVTRNVQDAATPTNFTVTPIRLLTFVKIN